jgi:5-hydroxytryptamine receptor 7
MGAFIACWLPFFIVALIRPLAGVKQVPDSVSSVFLWLGYANSFLNPLIYARFNRDFRRPFKDILLLRCRGINERVRSERYVEQYGGLGACHAGNGAAGLQTPV